ncbi:hypothetical protein [Limosilactobacillus antri]|uniref:Uncharacterized protein n=1 Tax=Limosilactobacillus antri DSM 16041 TaxID=525309 RepID=C8P4R1_9LACO|nr:hypothetical protein [Limosilactobacillus antri]EEW54505.1 hypothetical protein HMPREF0494_0305 [Limosilactobacillus antri DSM 16041]KRK60185.1 hypothetical protein FC31_GL001974 [Limosilactobacillus antri DSM 16041]
MKLRTWFWTLLSLILIVGVFSYGANNLGKYNFYYATHMKHPKNQYPFVTATSMNTMPFNYLPNYTVANSTTEPPTCYIAKTNVIEKGDYLRLNSYSLSYAHSKKQFENGKLLNIEFSERGYLSKIEKEKMGQTLYLSLNDIQAELKHNSERPTINLQWIYNWYFKSTNKN